MTQITEAAYNTLYEEDSIGEAFEIFTAGVYFEVLIASSGIIATENRFDAKQCYSAAAYFQAEDSLEIETTYHQFADMNEARTYAMSLLANADS